MLKYFYIQTIRVPAYGLFVVMGIVLCCCIALGVAKKRQHQTSLVILFGTVGGVGAIVGAKLLTLIIMSMREGEILLSWNEFIEAGYSYYGGLFGFFISIYVFVKYKKIEYEEYATSYIFLLPLLHCFWKISCFMGGCCFGIPYTGIGSVIFPEGINALAGISVFPVQLLESAIALLIAVIIIVLETKNKLYWSVSVYLVMYGTTRFAIEFLRYHDAGTKIASGHVCSIVSILIGLIAILIKKKQVEINK